VSINNSSHQHKIVPKYKTILLSLIYGTEENGGGREFALMVNERVVVYRVAVN
jgi:hypothetical protein